MAAALAHWRAIELASAREPQARVPFSVQHEGQVLAVGSVARRHLPALTPYARWLRLEADAVLFTAAPAERDSAFAQMNAALHASGHIVGWRDETYPVTVPATGQLLATFERAASRFWGTLTFGAHCNGYVAGPHGRPTALWIARRSFTKPTDPGLLDNLIGGGVPHGQTPQACVLREGWEEAGLRAEQMQGLQTGRVATVLRDIPEGLQHEWLHVFDLALPRDLTPINQDGEVAELKLMRMDDALAATNDMTVDAALATLDFALRHQLLPAEEARQLAARSAGLWR
jgi:8-oxo-dGTP pyrophosphatase MutT (NUDIX family)